MERMRSEEVDLEWNINVAKSLLKVKFRGVCSTKHSGLSNRGSEKVEPMSERDREDPGKGTYEIKFIQDKIKQKYLTKMCR